MPSDAAIRFDPVTPEHHPLSWSWPGMPHWREWRGDPGTEICYVAVIGRGRRGSHSVTFSAVGDLVMHHVSLVKDTAK
jgi:hypothetical protein